MAFSPTLKPGLYNNLLGVSLDLPKQHSFLQLAFIQPYYVQDIVGSVVKNWGEIEYNN